LVRDYFAQGFYPTAARADADRMPQVSGSLVRAALVASANFAEHFPIPADASPLERTIASSRGVNLASVTASSCAPSQVIGNSVQGYGRIVLDQALPLSDYPSGRGVGAPDTVELPAAGLLIWDMLGTAEPPIDNASHTGTEKTFRVDGPDAVTLPGGTRALASGQLRIALSWPDPPAAADSGGLLVNDLDLEVESPGPDNRIDTLSDNIVYDGNVYIANRPLPAGQWSLGRGIGDAPVHDTTNTIEAVHLSAYVDDVTPNQLVTGIWKVRVRRGTRGALPGQISVINGANEDTNGNGRLDQGEDLDGDGLLDAGGQPFALVVAGPVFGTSAQSWRGTAHQPPAGVLRLDRYRYGCADPVLATLFDPSATPASVSAATVYEVLDASGAVIDAETNIPFQEIEAGTGSFRAAPVAVRSSQQPVPYNGVLEGLDGDTIRVRYQGQPRPLEARARLRCATTLLQSSLEVPGQSDPGALIGGGCDGDDSLDSGERLTYSIALSNFGRDDDLRDVVARLTPAGPGAAAIRVLDSPRMIGRVPGGQATGVTFTLFVDPQAAASLAMADRRVDLVLTLETEGGVLTSGSRFTFTHAIDSDPEALHYSTDVPGGGREVRDFNRNLFIDRADTIDPFRGVFWPDEDVTFSTLFVPAYAGGPVSNTVGEDLNGNGVLDPGEDVIPNNQLDRGILAQAGGPSAGDKVPWNFDSGSGGFTPLRHPRSRPTGLSISPVWERVGGGVCGFQTALPDGDASAWFQNQGAGIWHTGDGVASTPSATASACDDYAVPSDAATPAGTELYLDLLLSPIVARVHQGPDARGFPYEVEFQRLGLNLNIQTSGYAGGFLDFDSDIDSDAARCLLCRGITGLLDEPDLYGLASFGPFREPIDPASGGVQRTFGPLTDPNGSFATHGVIDGDESGFSGFTSNINPDSSSPIPTAPPDLLPFPAPGGPQVCVPGCTGSGCCELNTVAGPERNLDLSLPDFRDGVVVPSPGTDGAATRPRFTPDPTGNRWQIAVGFAAM
ncbi:MAG TPA: hypothetical protein VNL37_00340, partial [Candidatus Polarisedimenticolia bacterium]|nr:hypothetical protein [Candidatus Polarisedimenticolia bacterium]